MHQPLDPERCYRAVAGRDARFDGWFFTAVHTTGIYCRPSCPARTPLARNVSFFTTAAAAQAAGFRACRRCRPDAAPGSPEWDVRADVVARAMRLIADGEVERSGVPGLAAHLGYSERQLHRLLVGELGVGALALARAQRAQTARLLIETTELPMADVAFAAGFASVRQFNDTVREVFATTPTGLRASRRGPVTGAPGRLTLRLAARAPYDAAEVLLFLGTHAVPGLEEWDGTTFSRVLDLPHGPAVVQLSPSSDGGPAVTALLRLTELRDLAAAVTRCRRMLDLDADPAAVDDV
ncbi:MAG: bifunctional transcriptional activator/DNA repair enzyme AdaA, partial [Blastococcus sp.]